MNACCRRPGCRSSPSPSTVTTSARPTLASGVTHERTARPPSVTVQAPHCCRAAAELRPVELQIVAQHVEQRRVRVGGDAARRAVDREREGLLGHRRQGVPCTAGANRATTKGCALGLAVRRAGDDTRHPASAACTAALGSAAVIAAPALITLPTAWRIQAPEGPVATVGTLPGGIVLSRDGAHAIELEAGYENRTLRVLDAATLREERAVKLSGAYGAPLRDPGGDGVWVSVAGTFDEGLAHVDTARGTVDRDVTLPVPFYPVALARAPDGTLAVAGDLANRIALVDPAAERVIATVGVGRHPAALAFSADGRTLYVADRAESALDVVDVRARRVRARIRVGLHPVALASDGRRLYVADSDDDDVAVVDLARERVVQRARVPFARAGVVGTSPNALALDGDRLYVSCGAANAVAVFRAGASGLTALGAIPAGWYPTAVAVDRAHGALFVADGKGESGHPNPKYRASGGDASSTSPRSSSARSGATRSRTTPRWRAAWPTCASWPSTSRCRAIRCCARTGRSSTSST